MLIKILCFLRGYVEIIVKSRFIERFINICTKRNIYLWDIKHKNASEADMKMSIRAFRKIRPVAKKTHSHVHIKSKHGLPVFLHRYKKRYFFLYGTLVAACFVFVMSQFVWSIEIVGNETVSSEKILAVLEEIGFKKGSYKHGFDARDLKNNALVRLDELSWIWVDIKGSRAIVSVNEKRAAPEMLNSDEACDIVASKPGVIKSIVAKQGQTAAKIGQTVMEGELLISGVVTSERIAPRYLHADGEVYARTWYEASDTYPLHEEIRTPTGNSANKNTLRLFGMDINFFINPASPYESSNTSETSHDWVIFGRYTGISWKSVTYTEVNITYNPITAEQAMELAAPGLEAKILPDVGEGAVFAARDIRYTPVDNENIKITLTMEYTEQIGIKKPIENVWEFENAENNEQNTQQN